MQDAPETTENTEEIIEAPVEATDMSDVADADEEVVIETAAANAPVEAVERSDDLSAEIAKDEDAGTDIFQWANQTDAVKNELRAEFFLFNRNYTPYSIRIDDALDTQIKALFLFDLINDVNLGAGTGLSVRDYELSDKEPDTLLRTDLEKVGRAETLIHLIKHERHDIVEFSEQEHEFKRIKGIVARFVRHDGTGEFFVVKQVSGSSALKGATSWEFNEGTFRAFQPEFGWTVPADNQVLIIDGDIFIFNQSKFERIFNYDYKKQLLADKKVTEIESKYKLSFAEGATLQAMVMEKKAIATKLQKLEVGAVSQEQAIDYADTMQLDLMTDDEGAIIIMDSNDLDMFVNLINEDYITSEVSGKRYVIKSKKPLDDPEGEPPRG